MMLFTLQLETKIVDAVDAVQCSVVQCGAVQCSAVQCSGAVLSGCPVNPALLVAPLPL